MFDSLAINVAATPTEEAALVLLRTVDAQYRFRLSFHAVQSAWLASRPGQIGSDAVLVTTITSVGVWSTPLHQNEVCRSVTLHVPSQGERHRRLGPAANANDCEHLSKQQNKLEEMVMRGSGVCSPGKTGTTSG
jgi:hypothetical protein